MHQKAELFLSAELFQTAGSSRCWLVEGWNKRWCICAVCYAAVKRVSETLRYWCRRRLVCIRWESKLAKCVVQSHSKSREGGYLPFVHMCVLQGRKLWGNVYQLCTLVISGGWDLEGSRPSLVAQTVKDPPAMQETQIQSLGWEDPLEEGMAIHSSVLAWRIQWTEEPGGPQPVGLQDHTWLSDCTTTLVWRTPWTEEPGRSQGHGPQSDTLQGDWEPTRRLLTFCLCVSWVC